MLMTAVAVTGRAMAVLFLFTIASAAMPRRVFDRWLPRAVFAVSAVARLFIGSFVLLVFITATVASFVVTPFPVRLLRSALRPVPMPMAVPTRG